MIQRSAECAADGTAAPATPPDGTRALAGAILAGEPAAFGPRLVVVEGPSAGAAFPVQDGAVLGRGRGAELRLSDPLASRRHAVFTICDGRALLQDLSSKNGLSVNGRRLGREAVALDPGDALHVGESVLVYEGERPPASVRATTGAPDAPRRSSTSDAPGPPSSSRRVAVVVPGLAGLALVAAAVFLALAAG